MTTTSSDGLRATVVLAGLHGHGRSHLAAVEALSRRSGIRLAGVCDPVPPSAEDAARLRDVVVTTRLDDLLDEVRPDVTIICTPIHTHAELARQALARGSHLLLEKPPTPTYDDFEALLADVDASGLTCQVGFQSLGSPAVDRIRELVRSGAVGEVVGIGAEGAWVRERAYYDRGRWAGRRSLDGVPVVDGVLTNPLAHSVSAALRIDGSETPDAVRDVAVELYRAHDIEADDTSCLRLRTRRGTVITVAATLCATRTHEPVVTVHGTRGRIALAYKRGEVRVRTDDRAEEVQVSTHPPVPLLENLVAHLHDPSVELLVPLRSTAGFMRVLDAVRCAPDPTPIPPEHWTAHGSGPAERRVVHGVDEAVTEAARRLRLFSELGVPWAAGAMSTVSAGEELGS
ncbi:MAG: Gfo/Idh/MocA family oxidoreductase [Actinomycetales bacterium]|nr:Gfo/Idh/MocA family oxidoreductase [Actinomycetales bacterium]